MIRRFNFIRFLKTALIFLMLYLIIILSTLFVFSDKLTYQELVAVTDFYEEIRLTDSTIKNDFYVNTVIKIIDKKIIYEELRKDALLCSLKVSENAFDIYMKDYKGVDALAYLNRCDFDFEIFTGLEVNTELIELYKSFFRADTKNIEDLETFNSKMLDMIEPEYEYIDSISVARSRTITIVILSYLILSLCCSILDFNKLFSRKEDKR